jgi:uncharacterized membrane protein YgcG
MKTILFVIFLLASSLVTFAQIPTRIENTRVQDHANLLTAEQRSALDQKLKAFNESKFTDLGVVTVPTTNGMAPVDFAVQTGRTYGIGHAEGEHRGIVFLLAINDRQCFIAPSRHIEYVYTDGRMGDICRGLRSDLRKQDYAAAINKGVDELIGMGAALDQTQVVGVKSDVPTTSSGDGILAALGFLILAGGIIGGIILFVRWRIKKREKAEAEAQHLKFLQQQAAERKRLEKQRAEEERKRKEHEAWLKTPEGIADTARKREEARLAEERRRKLEAEQRAKEAEERRRYAIWAASPIGIATLAQQKKEAQERARREAEEAARRRREAEEEEERRRKRRQDDDRSSSYSSSSYSSSSSSSSSSDSSSGFGGSSDFGGGGGGSSW